MDNTQQIDPNDPLAMPASSVSTDFPLLKEGAYRLTVKSVEVVEASDDTKAKITDPSIKAENLKITLQTTKDSLDLKDQVLHAGFPVSKFIPLFPIKTDKYERTVADIRKEVATFIKAVEGPKSDLPMSIVRTEPARFEGKPVDVKIGISKSKDPQYNDSNSVRFIIPG